MTTETGEGIMRIDIDNVLRQRLPWHYKYIPRFVIRGLEKIICQKRLNELLVHNGMSKGVDFCRGVIDELGVDYKVEGKFPSDDPRVVIVSNHPLGGLDGMVLADMVSRQYGGEKELKFVVNDLLTFVEPLRSIFLGVNKHGSQSRHAAEKLENAFASDKPIVMFPAGLVSRKGKGGVVEDLRWNKMVVNKAVAYKRNIIPVYFDGHNSQFFYKFANLRVRLGLKFNIEMVCLPREIFNSEGSTFKIRIGEPIRWESLRGGRDAQIQADRLREAVYMLRDLR